ncbi:MAG: tetratricopeptide repeat protein, partial [Xanthomonadales bacterium]|nr:tetratricopeptide repeat protein [Xanthomonadales bacterium]
MASSNAGLTYALPWLLALPGAVFGGDVVATGLAASDTLRLADELSASGRHGQAAAHYQALLDDPPTLWDGWMQAQVRLRLASSQLAQGEFATARGTLQSLQQAPAELQDAARALHSQIGEIESEAAQAQSVGLASLRADPDSVWGYRNLARALALQGRSAHSWTVLEQQLGQPDADMALAMIEATA